MATEHTLSIIKPDGVERDLIGKIFAQFEENDLRIVATRMVQLSRLEAEEFYSVHSDKPFFGELVEFMTRGPIVVSVLEGENAIAKHREVIGATNPADAEEGTVRAKYAESIGENTVHGSDAEETALKEIGFFFAGCELFSGRG
jgi:nucleoside-diphosphate kinase